MDTHKAESLRARLWKCADRKEAYKLIYMWVKHGHISAAEFAYLCEAAQLTNKGEAS